MNRHNVFKGSPTYRHRLKKLLKAAILIFIFSLTNKYIILKMET